MRSEHRPGLLNSLLRNLRLQLPKDPDSKGRRGNSLDAVAAQISRTKGYLSKIERGEIQVPPEDVMKDLVKVYARSEEMEEMLLGLHKLIARGDLTNDATEAWGRVRDYVAAVIASGHHQTIHIWVTNTPSRGIRERCIAKDRYYVSAQAFKISGEDRSSWCRERHQLNFFAYQALRRLPSPITLLSEMPPLSLRGCYCQVDNVFVCDEPEAWIPYGSFPITADVYGFNRVKQAIEYFENHTIARRRTMEAILSTLQSFDAQLDLNEDVWPSRNNEF